MKRRNFLIHGLACSLCAPALSQEAETPEASFTPPKIPGTHMNEHGELIADLDYQIPAELQPRFVNLVSDIPEGDIHISPAGFSLFLGLGNMTAIQYPCGVGKEGRYRSGTFRIARKVEWPSWTPTRNMIRREPEKYRPYASGMQGGPENPLGARALYLHHLRGGRDTFMRIHGTPQPWTVATASSSGCVRMINAHVIDLFNRVPTGTEVTLYPVDEDYDPTVS